MPMNVTNSCIQDSHDAKTISLKRKSEDYFLAGNVSDDKQNMAIFMVAKQGLLT